MDRHAGFFNKLIYPVTPLVVLAGISLVSSIWAFIKIFTTDQPTAFLAAFVVGISQSVLVLYIIDRIVVRFLNYNVILIGELIIIIMAIFSFYSVT